MAKWVKQFSRLLIKWIKRGAVTNMKVSHIIIQVTLKMIFQYINQVIGQYVVLLTISK